MFLKTLTPTGNKNCKIKMSGPEIKSIEDLKGLLVDGLRDFLNARGVRVSGNRKELLHRAELYFDAPVIRTGGASARGASARVASAGGASAGISLPSDKSIFEDASLGDGWKELTPQTKVTIPKEFSIAVLTDYLTKLPVSLGAAAAGDDEEVNAGTGKPVVKGRQMYVSKRLTLVEYTTSTTHIFFRANCDASMRNMVRYPGMYILSPSLTVRLNIW